FLSQRNDSFSAEFCGLIVMTVEVASFRQRADSSRPPLEKECADSVVVGETDRAVEGLGGLMRTVLLPQQVGANGPVGLVGNHRVRIDLIQQRQSGLGPVNLGMRRGARHGSADRWRPPPQL